MENFLLAFNVVFPIFLIMMLGVILKRKSIVDEKSLNVMNSLIFRLFMPTLLFFNIYNMGDLSTLSFDNLKLLAYAFSSILIVLFLAWLIYMPKVKEKKKFGKKHGNALLCTDIFIMNRSRLKAIKRN